MVIINRTIKDPLSSPSLLSPTVPNKLMQIVNSLRLHRHPWHIGSAQVKGILTDRQKPQPQQLNVAALSASVGWPHPGPGWLDAGSLYAELGSRVTSCHIKKMGRWTSHVGHFGDSRADVGMVSVERLPGKSCNFWIIWMTWRRWAAVAPAHVSVMSASERIEKRGDHLSRGDHRLLGVALNYASDGPSMGMIRNKADWPVLGLVGFVESYHQPLMMLIRCYLYLFFSVDVTMMVFDGSFSLRSC